MKPKLLGIFLTTFPLIIFGSVIFDEGKNETEIIRTRRIINGRHDFESDFVVHLFGKAPSSFLHLQSFICGGSLIDYKWVLTAAHCFMNEDKYFNLADPHKWHIRFDKMREPTFYERMVNVVARVFNAFSRKKKLPQSYYHIDEIHVHPKYIPGILEYDIALIKIRERLDLYDRNYISTISLPDDDQEVYPKDGDSCFALGWGCNERGGSADNYLKSIEIPVINHDECMRTYRTNQVTKESEFCAGKVMGNVGICRGDSGGPLVCKKNGNNYVAGVTSASSANSPESHPGIFTRVSYFLPWIKAVMRR